MELNGRTSWGANLLNWGASERPISKQHDQKMIRHHNPRLVQDQEATGCPCWGQNHLPAIGVDRWSWRTSTLIHEGFVSDQTTWPRVSWTFGQQVCILEKMVTTCNNMYCNNYCKPLHPWTFWHLLRKNVWVDFDEKLLGGEGRDDSDGWWPMSLIMFFQYLGLSKVIFIVPLYIPRCKYKLKPSFRDVFWFLLFF